MATSFLEQVGERLRYFRESKGYTLEEIKRQTGVDVTYLSGIERGHLKPLYSMYADICITIGITTADLFGYFHWTYTEPKLSAPVIKCKKVPVKKCSFVAEVNAI